MARARVSSHRPLRFAVTTSLGAALLGLVLPVASATAAPENDFEMPFPCGQSWAGATRASHSPSAKAIDWNRADDDGDPVVSSAPGTVVVAANGSTGYGHWVMVEHADSENTIYAHLSSVTVSVGQTVDQGMLLGTVGSTGNSSGSHLHYEQRADRSTIDPWFHGTKFAMGSTLASKNCVDVPLAGNFVGDPAAELVVYRRSETSTFRVMRPDRSPQVLSFGAATDQPVLGDWDGDGRANLGVRNPESKTFLLRTGQGVLSVALGSVQDQPIAGDWDGDGRWEIGVRRPATATFRLRAANGTISAVSLGNADDIPLTGDWDGDGRTDLAVFDAATAVFTLRRVDREGVVWTARVPFGDPGDLPVTGDWDANQRTDLGVWDPATATFELRVAPSASSTRSTLRETRFGNPR